MKTKRYKFRSKGRFTSHEVWVTRQHLAKIEIQAKRNREADRVLHDMMSCGSLALKLMLKADKRPKIAREILIGKKRNIDYDAAQRQLDSMMNVPQGRFTGGKRMDILDKKLIEYFPGKVVRKDLTSLMKKGANVPTYVLEYLLGMYCSTDDEDIIQSGIEKIKQILSENYVRPDQSEYVKSKIKENGQHTIVDKITVEFDEREDKYVARFVNLKIAPFEVNSDLVVHNEKLLVGGIWCIVRIEYVGLEKEENEPEEYEEDIFGDRKAQKKKISKEEVEI